MNDKSRLIPDSWAIKILELLALKFLIDLLSIEG